MSISLFRKARVIAAVFAFAASLGAADLDRIIGEIRAELQPAQAMDRMHRIYSTERWFNFPKFQQTAEYLKSEMQAIGLSDVELVPTPADGVTKVGWWTMPLAWDVKNARLEIVEPAVPAAERVLADYLKIPASLGMWSGPTPPGGLTAEIVEVRGLSTAEIERVDMKGKFVMVRQSIYANKSPFVKKGAIGIINASTENEELRDGHWWVNYWGDNGWGFTKTSTPLPCFSVTPRQADLLSNLLARNGKVRVKAVVDSRYYPGSYPYTTAVLKGTSDEEVIELGHTTEQGANDNATGVAVMVESLATLNRLVASGRLSRPRRSIRILAMPEMYGSWHYVGANPERIRRTVAAICLDTPAGPYDMAGTEYAMVLNPDVARSYTDALIVRVAQAYFRRLGTRRTFHEVPFITGTDTLYSDPMVGIPTVWAYGGSGINTHHNSEDTPEKTDARSMRDASVMTAAFLYYVASAGEAEVPWLAELTATRGQRSLVERATAALDGVSRAEGREALARLLRDGLDRIEYEAEREREAVRSPLRLAAAEKRAALETAIAPAIDSVAKLARGEAERLRLAVGARARELGIAGVIEPAPADAVARMADAARLVVKRKRYGPITMDDLSTDAWEGYPSAGWDRRLIIAHQWCDGKRTLADVVRRTRMECGPDSFDWVGYFRFLAKHGYVEVSTAP